VTFGVIFSYIQIKKISKSIEIGQKANSINVLNFFAKEYDCLMIEAEQCRSERKADLWYFRFWSLFKNEFLFFEEGLLDDYIFEFWSFKMCTEYDCRPKHIPLRKIDTFKRSHLKYLKGRNGNHPNTEKYFLELIEISDSAKGDDEMKICVHDLVRKYKKLK
jgi:hypothetical protein